MTISFRPAVSEVALAEALDRLESGSGTDANLRIVGTRLTSVVTNAVFSVLILVSGAFSAYYGYLDTVDVVSLPGFFGPGFLIVGPIAILFGLVKLLRTGVRALRKPRRTTPYEVGREFYAALFDDAEILRDYGRALLVTAPARRPLSLQTLRQLWTDADTAVKRLIIHDKMACTMCQREEPAVSVLNFVDWGKYARVYARPTDLIIKNEDIWHECGQCHAPLCGSCFASIPERDFCKRCKMFMLKGSQIASLPLITHRRLEFATTSLRSVKALPTYDPRVFRIVASVTFTAKHRIPKQADSSTRSINLGDRGVLTCDFHNFAVHAESGWYVIACEPGALVTNDTGSVNGETFGAA